MRCNRVLLVLCGCALFAGTAQAGWETVCERVPVTKMLPGTIERPVFVTEPALRCRREWITESPEERDVEDVTFYIRDLESLCLQLDYPPERCWEILAGVDPAGP